MEFHIKEIVNRLHDEPLPVDSKVPRIVHQIVWRNTFTFRNYLSIMSVYKNLNPYKIILYVSEKKFKIQEYEYNSWFRKASQQIPSIELSFLAPLDKSKRRYFFDEIGLISSVLSNFGGLYVNINTIMTGEIWQKNSGESFLAGLTRTNRTYFIGFIMAAQTKNLKHFLREITTPSYFMTHGYETECAFSATFSEAEDCCIMLADFFPVDIISENSFFGSVVRGLFYGTPTIPEPKRVFPPIPKIVHYIWIGTQPITYVMFLSFKSTLRFVKPLKIFIYVDTFELGKYFEEMRSFKCVQIVFYGTPFWVFQRRILNPSHASDVVRADVLLRYGGIYIDWDVFWLKPVDDLLSIGYETIASLDFYVDMHPRPEFPDTINMGVLFARPGSRFIALWQDTFKQYVGNHPTFHAVEIVYKVYEEHPDLLYLEKRLQVICFHLLCHPLWLSNYKDTNIHNTFDFTKDAYSVHFTYPTPKEFESEHEMNSSKGFFADMARHVYGLANAYD